MKIAVLGCGPAGLIAAHAIRVAEGDHQVVIISKRRKSHMFGAQYLHAPIPGVTNSSDYATIRYKMLGSADDYRRKVYGDMWDGTVSPEDLAYTHQAWDIREAYDRLWTMYSYHVIDCPMNPAEMQRFVDNKNAFDLIVNTIPLRTLCSRGHTFGTTEIIAAGDAPQNGIDVGALYSCPADTVICNGEEHPSWYRLSRIFGHTTIEWPGDIDVPIPTASKVEKPTFNNCDCWSPERVLNVGRYGSWKKGVLTNHVYEDVLERIEG